MRGRLWALYVFQVLGGVCSLCMYYARGSLGLTMMVVAFWSIFVPMACGATFGIVPFVTKKRKDSNGWGSIFFRGRVEVSEEDYHLRDFTEEEMKEGCHLSVVKFAKESHSLRGSRGEGSLSNGNQNPTTM